MLYMHYLVLTVKTKPIVAILIVLTGLYSNKECFSTSDWAITSPNPHTVPVDMDGITMDGSLVILIVLLHVVVLV